MTRPRKRRAAFTLIELLITISIVALMAGMVLFAGYSAQESAREQKTRTLITKLDAIIKSKWEAYKTRRVPILLDENWNDTNGNGTAEANEYTDLDGSGSPTSFSPPTKAKFRLDALRDLMRMELPDRWSDVVDDPVAPLPYATGFKVARPSVSRAYLRRYNAVMSGPNPPPPTILGDYQGAECLYMIVMATIGEEGDSRDVFKAGDFGDKDGDGFPEFWDAWGQPIKFLRWPAGFASELQVVASDRPSSVSGGGQSVTITINVQAPAAQPWHPAFSTQNGAYVGGAVAKQDPGTTLSQFKVDALARITQYTFNSATGQAQFICSTPSSTMQQTFYGQPPGSTDTIYVFTPDPFDPTGVYPKYPNGGSSWPMGQPDVSRPSYATYPLIFSGGPDKCYGFDIDPDNPSGGTMHYADPVGVALNPFYADKANGRMVGKVGDNAAEANFVSNGSVDNIHNHLLNTR